jgi:hypothetical protein
MKPALSTTAIAVRLAALGGLLATAAWTPGTIDANGQADRMISARDNCNVRLLGSTQVASPELPWFLKPVTPAQTERNKDAKLAKAVGQEASFIENKGQVKDLNGNPNPNVLFFTSKNDSKIYFTKSGIGFAFYAESAPPSTDANGMRIHTCQTNMLPNKYHVMEMELIGYNPDAKIVGEDQLGAAYNYISGEKKDWITGISSYKTITYQNIYKNIDLVVHAQSQGMKYDFVVRPGGNVADIRYHYTGSKNVSLSNEGKLIIATPVGTVEEQAPMTFQDGKTVSSAYQINKGVVSFKVGAFDQNQTLTIDPITVWATYFGGTGGDRFEDVELAADGSFVAVGNSSSASIPTAAAIPLAGLVQGTRGSTDALAAKFSATGVLIWYTWIAGSQNEVINSVELDDPTNTNYNVYVMGTTNSKPTDGFPVTGTVPQSAKGDASDDQWVACLQGTAIGGGAPVAGGTIRWLSYKGSDGTDVGLRLSVRTVNVIVPPATSATAERIIAGVGYSNGSYPTGASAAFAVSRGAGPCSGEPVPFDNTFGGGTSATGTSGGDATLFVWRETGTSTVVEDWSTYLGGENVDLATGVEIGSDGSIRISGTTESVDATTAPAAADPFPTRGGAGTILLKINSASAQTDAFLGKFSYRGCLLCLGYIGGEGNDFANDMGMDITNDHVYLVGRTLSTGDSSPLGPGGIDFTAITYDNNIGQRVRSGTGADGWICHANTDCVALCSTFHGGTSEDTAEDVDVLPNSAATETTTVLVCGTTESNNATGAGFPISPASSQCVPPGGAPNALQSAFGGVRDQWAACYSPTCCRLWSTYYGGSNQELGLGISAVKLSNPTRDAVIVCGEANQGYPTVNNFPGTPYFQSTSTPGGIPEGVLLYFTFRLDEKLPIELAGFSVATAGRTVQMKWNTASEESNAGFIVERAELPTGYEYPVFKGISSYLKNSDLVGLGTSPIGKSYNFVDDEPALKTGVYYAYRIVDVSYEGVRTAHPAITVSLDEAGPQTPVDVTGFTVGAPTPNPANDQLAVSFKLSEPETVTVELYSMDGKKVMTPIANKAYSTAGDKVEQFPVSELPAGSYTAVVSTGNYSRVRTRQFVIVR